MVPLRNVSQELAQARDFLEYTVDVELALLHQVAKLS
jgi:hypothetical protein